VFFKGNHMEKKIKTIKPVVKISGVNVGQKVDNENTTPWPTAFGVPNTMLRSALFGIQRERSGLSMIDNMILMCPREATIKYSGPRLNQDDSLVWQMIIRAVRQSKVPMGGIIQLSYQDIIKSLGLSDGGANFNWLKACLERLHKAHVVIDTPTEVIRSHLLVGYSTEKKTKKIKVGISALLVPLFAEDLTDVDVLRKASLKSQLSRWLHDFYSSHSNPIPYSIEKIKELSRSEAQTSKFRQMVIKSMEELKECDPPLFSKETFFDKKTDSLIVFKATNSPGIPPKKNIDDEVIKSEVVVFKNTNKIKKEKINFEKDNNEVEKIMKKFGLTENQVQQLDKNEYKNYLLNLKPIL
jgi:hypothetical protein